jgi:hypothetical protein
MKLHQTENDQFLHHVQVDTEARFFPFSTRPSLDVAVLRSEKALEKDGSFLLKLGLTFSFLLLCNPRSEWPIWVSGMLFFSPRGEF